MGSPLKNGLFSAIATLIMVVIFNLIITLTPGESLITSLVLYYSLLNIFASDDRESCNIEQIAKIERKIMERKINLTIPKNPKQGDIFCNVKERSFYTFWNEEWVEGLEEDWLIGIDLAHGKDC